MTSGYSNAQIKLHWAIVCLVLIQYLSHWGMVGAMRALKLNSTPGFGDFLLSNLHLLSGLGILILMIYRAILRIRSRQARLSSRQPVAAHERLPRAASDEFVQNRLIAIRSRLMGWLALTVHRLFYLILVLMPVSGLFAYYRVVDEAAVLHRWGRLLLLILIGLHVVAALYHGLWLKDGRLQRMIKPRAENG